MFPLPPAVVDRSMELAARAPLTVREFAVTSNVFKAPEAPLPRFRLFASEMKTEPAVAFAVRLTVSIASLLPALVPIFPVSAVKLI